MEKRKTEWNWAREGAKTELNWAHKKKRKKQNWGRAFLKEQAGKEEGSGFAPEEKKSEDKIRH